MSVRNFILSALGCVAFLYVVIVGDRARGAATATRQAMALMFEVARADLVPGVVITCYRSQDATADFSNWQEFVSFRVTSGPTNAEFYQVRGKKP